MYINIKHCLITVIILTVILLSSISYAIDVFPGWVRGERWQSFSEETKYFYIAGVIDGQGLTVKITGVGPERIYIIKPCSTEITRSASYYYYSKALDQFYEDCKNELIPAYTALVIASKEIQGENTKEYVREMRWFFHGMMELNKKTKD